ncbi:hypothetical protein [Chryseobacterium populi]|uniref:Lipoprotein n=1 Tax=Chryseobacterium populi TaxID=1144316 RepID=J2TD14_9FLAO|nr:hypothetical protein [Chryseobacterium populi]EJL76057.1 hypothetical protein PMI13_00026 [Chryseobacterium populi]
MILHTKFYSLLIFIILSCSNDKKSEVSDINETSKSFDSINSKKYKNFQPTIWDCYKYEIDNRYPSDYGEDYAKEFSAFSSFVLTNDSIFIGDCKEPINQYKYPTKLKRFDEESTFITFYKPKTDSIQLISAKPIGKSESCIPLDNTIIYRVDSNELIIHDRGYFFHYHKRASLQKQDIKVNEIIGLPGNNRTAWIVRSIINTNNLEDAYKYFIKNFPYGAKGLQEKFPKDKNYIDDKNNVTYNYSENSLIINKSDPMGEIIISLELVDNKVKLAYKMEFPSYD